MGDGETVEELFAYYDRVAEATGKTVRDIADLGHPVPIDHSAPWNPREYDAWSLRWVLLHLIQETARHTGHADVIRQTVDGATAYPLMAAAEGWPETRWMKPWKKEA